MDESAKKIFNSILTEKKTFVPPGLNLLKEFTLVNGDTI